MKPVLSWMTAAVLALAFVHGASAQTPAPMAPAAPMAASPNPASDEAKKAKAKECSAQADAKGLHGKARKEFRSKCKRS